MNYGTEKAGIKTATCPQTCCRTSVQNYFSVQLYSFIATLILIKVMQNICMQLMN